MLEAHNIKVIVKYDDKEIYKTTNLLRKVYVDELLGDKQNLFILEKMIETLYSQIKVIRRDIREWPKQLEVLSSSSEPQE